MRSKKRFIGKEAYHDFVCVRLRMQNLENYQYFLCTKLEIITQGTSSDFSVRKFHALPATFCSHFTYLSFSNMNNWRQLLRQCDLRVQDFVCCGDFYVFVFCFSSNLLYKRYSRTYMHDTKFNMIQSCTS